MRLPSLDIKSSKAQVIYDSLIKYNHLNLYKVTISSNYAKKEDALPVYRYIVDRLPGFKVMTQELSSKGKYHFHGFLQTSCTMMYSNILDAKQHLQAHYDVHVEYRLLDDANQAFQIWLFYICKQKSIVEQFHEGIVKLKPPKKSCIPLKELRTYYKPMDI